MDHSEAELNKAVERYVLGDLSVSEVEEFERHFFDCPQCSEELRTLSIFQDNARAVLIEQGLRPSLETVPAHASAAKVTAISAQTEKPVRRGLPLFWQRCGVVPVGAMALAALLIGAFGTYFVFVPPLRRVQSVSEFPLYAIARGTETIVAPKSGSAFYTVYMDPSWDGEYVSYRAIVRDDLRNDTSAKAEAGAASNGQERCSLPVEPPLQGGSMHVLLPSHMLSAGRYLLVMFGTDKSGKEIEVARYPFTLRFE